MGETGNGEEEEVGGIDGGLTSCKELASVISLDTRSVYIAISEPDPPSSIDTRCGSFLCIYCCMCLFFVCCQAGGGGGGVGANMTLSVGLYLLYVQVLESRLVCCGYHKYPRITIS